MDRKLVRLENGLYNMEYKKVVEERVKSQGKLKEDEYYITDNGLFVFTETYHIRRGHCCGLKCKHCPYSPKLQEKQSLIYDTLLVNLPTLKKEEVSQIFNFVYNDYSHVLELKNGELKIKKVFGEE